VKRRFVIVTGVVLFLLLAVICLLIHVKKIETKLTELATEKIGAAGIGGAAVSFDGRNAILNGAVASEDVSGKAAAMVGEINGVRSVDNGLTVTAPVEVTEDTTEDKPDERPAEPQISLAEQLSGLYVNFASKSSEPGSGSMDVLNRVAGLLQENAGAKIEIAGHADSRGTLKFNQQLSLRRANAVKDRLINRGVNADRLFIKGYGETKPVADNSTPAGMEKNRRVEFIIARED